MQLCSRCYLCGEEAENYCHLFIHCVVSRVLWNPFLSMKGLSWIMPRTRGELPSCWNFSGGLIGQKKWQKIIPSGPFERKETLIVLKEQQLLTKDQYELSFLFRFWCKEDFIQDIDSLVDIIASLQQVVEDMHAVGFFVYGFSSLCATLVYYCFRSQKTIYAQNEV